MEKRLILAGGGGGRSAALRSSTRAAWQRPTPRGSPSAAHTRGGLAWTHQSAHSVALPPPSLPPARRAGRLGSLAPETRSCAGPLPTSLKTRETRQLVSQAKKITREQTKLQDLQRSGARPSPTPRTLRDSFKIKMISASYALKKKNNFCGVAFGASTLM